MSRYIDADKLPRHGKRGGVVYWRDIEAQPPADVVERSSYESMEHTVAKLNEALSNSVEVVRCKDCKHYKRNVPCVGGHYNGCDEWLDEGSPISVYDNDYCSYGERADT